MIQVNKGNHKILILCLSVILLAGCSTDFRTWIQSTPDTYEECMVAGNSAKQNYDSDTALKFYLKAMKRAEDEYGPDDIRIANAGVYAAGLVASKGQFGEAEQLYKRSLQVQLKSLEPNSPDVVQTRKLLAFVLTQNFKEEEAKKVLAGIK